ncbi:hypothetical protein DsansV1_C30g0215571 [Dioscorea sansibarensis]
MAKYSLILHEIMIRTSPVDTQLMDLYWSIKRSLIATSLKKLEYTLIVLEMELPAETADQGAYLLHCHAIKVSFRGNKSEAHPSTGHHRRHCSLISLSPLFRSEDKQHCPERRNFCTYVLSYQIIIN